MTIRISTTIILTILICLLLCSHSLAGRVMSTDSADEGHPGLLKARAKAYSIPLISRGPISEKPSERRIPLTSGSVSSSSMSPGVTIGYTWHDLQQIGAMGRMNGTGPHSYELGSQPAIVHMGYMYLDDQAIDSDLDYAYVAYNSIDHSLLSPVLVTAAYGRAGYINLDVTPDNRAIVGGHLDEFGWYQPHFFFDGYPAGGYFPSSARIPDSIAAWGQYTSNEAMWPKFVFQFGEDTVLHVVAAMNEPEWVTGRALMYFRKEGFEGSYDIEWDVPPYTVDTIETFGYDLAAQWDGDRVSLVWAAALPYDNPTCDTCSGLHNEVYAGLLIGQMDNDIYTQESYNQGMTFNPRINITQIPIGEAAFKAYTDLSAVYDDADNLHIVWPAVPWPEDTCTGSGGGCFEEWLLMKGWNVDKARLLHWSENLPYIRTICDHTYDPIDSCGPGQWALRIAKPSISQCEGKLYTIWTQFNDQPGGIINDCAEWRWEEGVGYGYYPDNYSGPANGEIWLSVSEDYGMTWDAQRNLTNSYTPHCDPDIAQDCQSDYWASMSPFGRQNEYGEDWTGAIVVDPSGGMYSGDYYLDIQYVNDLDAGAVVLDQGDWTLNPIKWFRMPCVDPIPSPIFYAEWDSLGDPFYLKPGEFCDTTLTLYNFGNTALTYSIASEEDNGPPGWLGFSYFTGSIPTGLSGHETGLVLLNQACWSTPGTFYGRLHFEGDDPINLPFDVEIELILADTIVMPAWNTLEFEQPTDAGNSKKLIVSNHGNMGGLGKGTGNMAFYPDDCDTTAKVYMYDGSPVVGRIMGSDTVFNFVIWGTTFVNRFGFRPQGNESTNEICGPLATDFFETGVFTTQDSAIAFKKFYIAPNEADFIVAYMKVWSFDGYIHEDLVLGEAIDWDIPADFLPDDVNRTGIATNTGGVDATRGLVYQQGYESYSDTTYPYNCQYNDARFGGHAFVESYFNSVPLIPGLYGGFIGENDKLQASTGFHHGKLYQEMVQPDLRGTDAVEDLHTVLTYDDNLSIGPDDVYEVVTILATIREGTLSDLEAAIDAGQAWYASNGGISMFEDVDPANGLVDMCESCCMQMGKFYNDGYSFNILDIDNFIEWLLRDPAGPPWPDCEEQIDVSGSQPGVPNGMIDLLDIDFMVGYLMRCDVDALGCCSWGGGCTEGGCNCCGTKGDANLDGDVDDDDLTYFANWLFSGGYSPYCCGNLDMDSDNVIDVFDYNYLYDYLHSGGPEPEPCDPEQQPYDNCPGIIE